MSKVFTSSLARQLCSRRANTAASSLRYIKPESRLLKTSHRWQSTAAARQAADGPPISQANRVEATMKRFWKKVDVEQISVDGQDHLVVKLDKRSLKTPEGNVLTLPVSKRLAASLVAHEWEKQEKLIKPHALPMTSIVSRAIDGLRDPTTHAEVREALLKYLDTDTICFHEEHPPALVRLQAQHWEPLIERIEKEYGVKVNIIKTLFGAGQPPATRRILAAVIEDFDEWELAALERSVYATKSFLTGFALVKGHLSVDDLANVAQVEVLSQIETWGEVEDSHDVDYRDIRRQLGSAACLLADA
ncbi:ATP synthase complex assembly protein atp12 [Tulasnella sp. 424]|nr:ATP synthase complex assembly protein atp12 [Tulasnella sp. 424]